MRESETIVAIALAVAIVLIALAVVQFVGAANTLTLSSGGTSLIATKV